VTRILFVQTEIHKYSSIFIQYYKLIFIKQAVLCQNKRQHFCPYAYIYRGSSGLQTRSHSIQHLRIRHPPVTSNKYCSLYRWHNNLHWINQHRCDNYTFVNPYRYFISLVWIQKKTLPKTQTLFSVYVNTVLSSNWNLKIYLGSRKWNTFEKH